MSSRLSVAGYLWGHQCSHRSPNLFCYGKSSFCIGQLRFPSIVGMTDINGVRIQFHQILCMQRELVFRGDQRREYFHIVGARSLNTKVRNQALQILALTACWHY